MSNPSIPLDISWDNLDNIRPWNIMDGKWGGWGPAYWRRAQEFGFAKGDVIEWGHIEGKPTWKRIWIEADLKWRELTADEVARLPVFKPLVAPRFDWIPAWPLKSSPEAAEALASILVQPTLQVIEQAPVLAKMFATKPLDTPPQVD